MASDASPVVQRHSADVDGFGIGDTKVQHYGLLMKKPFGHKSGRWQRRFFIVKEGFMLYYNDSESRLFEKSHHFNIHPKGVIPLGRCTVEETVSGPQKFALRISNQNFKGEIWVGAETSEECQEWKKAIMEAGTVTWKNAQLGERIILQMESKSKDMAEEMNSTIAKLNEEASALESEKEKKSELEALSAKLEEEKKAIEDAARDLRNENDTAHLELQQTLESMKHIEQEKESLAAKTVNLEANLQTISEEQEKTAAELEERARLAQQLEEEKKQLEEKTTNLEGDLVSMEEKQRLIEEEKKKTAERLLDQELTSQKLEEEKKRISTTALSLQADLEEVSKEKELTETKWKEEKKRRIKTEKRLRLAEDSLKRLDMALRDSGVQIDLQIETDVKNLRDFFEDCIKEERYEAEKLDNLRDAFKATTTYKTEAKKTTATTTRGDSIVLEEGFASSREDTPDPAAQNGVGNGTVVLENGSGITILENGNKVLNGTENGVSNGTENGVSNGTDNGVLNGTENGDGSHGVPTEVPAE